MTVQCISASSIPKIREVSVVQNIQFITVLYDSDCSFCRRCKNWLASEPKRIALEFVPIKSDRAANILYALEKDKITELVVITDKGEVFYKEKALLLCLYALTEYYEWAFQFSKPLFFPLIRNAYLMLSLNRERIANYFNAYSEGHKLNVLKEYTVPEVCNVKKHAES